MLVFVTSVVHPDNCNSYEKIWQLLNNTLYSVCSQQDQNFRVIVVCNKQMPLYHHAELINRHTEFIVVDFPGDLEEAISNFKRLGNLPLPPEDPYWFRNPENFDSIAKVEMRSLVGRVLRREIGVRSFVRKVLRRFDIPREVHSKERRAAMSLFRIDKGSKLLIGILAARKYNPEYVLIFDADDFVGNDISAFVNTRPGENGWIMTSVYRMNGTMIQPVYARYTICGTGNIFNFPLLMEDISPDVSENSTQNELFEHVDSQFLMFILGTHRQARLYYEEKGRPFQDYPFRSVVYLIGHGENHSERVPRPRGWRKSKEVIPISPELEHYFNIVHIDHQANRSEA